MKSPYEIIIRPVLTEKSTLQKDKHNQYTFLVARDANKVEIRQAVEKVFGVKVRKVNTSIHHVKVRRVRWAAGRTPRTKKAIITLAEGQTIDLF